MPWRLIQFIVLFAIFLLFIIFNLGNKCDISFGFAVIKEVPVFLTIFSSFMLGILCTFPIIFGLKSRKKTTSVQGKGLLAKATKKQGNNFGDKPKDNLIDTKHYGID